MFEEKKNCYCNSAANFVRVIVDTDTNVMYLANKSNMIVMLAKDGKPSLFTDKTRIVNYTDSFKRITCFIGWQNIFVNEDDNTMYIGDDKILVQCLDEKGMPKIFSN